MAEKNKAPISTKASGGGADEKPWILRWRRLRSSLARVR